jgi:predicted MFS family arabinose efflux permease
MMGWSITFFIVAAILAVTGALVLTFSERLNEAAMRRRPPPKANKEESLRLFRIRASGLIAGAVVFFLAAILMTTR